MTRSPRIISELLRQQEIITDKKPKYPEGAVYISNFFLWNIYIEWIKFGKKSWKYFLILEYNRRFLQIFRIFQQTYVSGAHLRRIYSQLSELKKARFISLRENGDVSSRNRNPLNRNSTTDMSCCQPLYQNSQIEKYTGCSRGTNVVQDRLMAIKDRFATNR